MSGPEVRDAYARWSSRYDQDPNRTRDLDRQATRELLAQRRFERVLELGCGTGKNTALLAEIGGRVRALDFSDAMLAVARAKVTASHVEFLLADLTLPWPCEARWADLVVCNLVLEHVEQVAPVFAQAARCLARGGLFLLCELHPFRQYQGTRARFAAADGSQVLIPAHVHHLSDYFGAARAAGLRVERFDEWWHEEDRGLPPRLVSLCCISAG